MTILHQNHRDLHYGHFPTMLGREVLALVCDDYLGRGQYREVYSYARDPKGWVVKLENGHQSFANVREWEAWRAVRETKWAPWFAPCHTISGSGLVLIQARTTPLDPVDLPKRVPAFFTDLKPENWGRYEGRIVCHDYGNHLLHENGMTDRMRKADWFR